MGSTPPQSLAASALIAHSTNADKLVETREPIGRPPRSLSPPNHGSAIAYRLLLRSSIRVSLLTSLSSVYFRRPYAEETPEQIVEGTLCNSSAQQNPGKTQREGLDRRGVEIETNFDDVMEPRPLDML